VVKTFSMLGW